jgi:hypothetical protein
MHSPSRKVRQAIFAACALAKLRETSVRTGTASTHTNRTPQAMTTITKRPDSSAAPK